VQNLLQQMVCPRCSCVLPAMPQLSCLPCRTRALPPSTCILTGALVWGSRNNGSRTCRTLSSQEVRALLPLFLRVLQFWYPLLRGKGCEAAEVLNLERSTDLKD
jgi:hypothetical protein